MSSNTQPKAAETRAEAKKDAAPEAAKNDAGTGAAAPMKKFDVGRKLGSFKRKLSAYTRVKTRSMEALHGEKDEKPADSSDAKAADADGEKKPVSKVLECYRLIRNFCITYNWIALEGKKESYLFVPDDFAADLKALLSEESLKKFLAAMEGPVADVVTTLPAEYDDAQVKRITTFIDDKDKDAIIGRLKKEIDSLSAEFEVLKAAKKASSETKASKTKKKDAPKKAANVTSSKESRSKSRSKAKDPAFCAETMFKDMISQIKKRVSSIRFERDDYQVFSEVQGQIDLLLFDASSELHRIKKSIKAKFENAQKKAESVRASRNGGKGRRSVRRDSDSQRRSRSRRNGEPNSVFSKGHEERFD